jgi:general secretion pathway protein D
VGGAAPASAAQRSVQYTFVRPADPAFDDSLEEEVASATLGTAEQSALTVTIDPRTNSLLVGGSDRYIDLVSHIIDQLDSSSARERRSEVIRMKNSQASDVATAIRTFLDQQRQRAVQALGADAATASARTIDQEEVSITAEPVSNTLLLSAHHQYFQQMRKMIDDLDAPQPQVLIQILLAEVTLTDQTDLGAEWSLTRHGGDGETYSVGSSLGVANTLQSLGGFSTAASGTDLNFLIRALTTDGKLAVLSRPEIVTGDNKPASINVGQRVPLVQGTRTDVNNNLNTTINYEQVGISLTVTPKISPEGFVKMDVGMTNSDVSAQTVTIAGAGVVPILDEAYANTTVTAHSGQTIIIGGLIATSDSKTIQKLPYLGDIPYIGAAFRTSSVIRSRKELLILLTPHVLANRPVPSPLEDPSEVTREQIKSSNLRGGYDLDPVERKLLDIYFPTNSLEPRISLPPPSTNSITIPK